MLTLDLWQNLCRSKGNGKIYVKGWKGKKTKQNKTTTKMDCKESWAQRNWCFWTVLLEKTFESRFWDSQDFWEDCQEIQTIHPKGDPSWVFTGRSNVEAETPILWPPDTKSWLIWKEPDAGKGWGQEEKRTTEGEMVGRHHWLNGHEFGWTPGVCFNSRPLPSNHLILCCPLLRLLSVFPSITVFPMSQLFASGASTSASVLTMNIQGWFPLRLTGLSPCCPRDSQESFRTPQFKSINSSVLSILYGPTLTSVHDYLKTHSFDFMDRCWQSNISAF